MAHKQYGQQRKICKKTFGKLMTNCTCEKMKGALCKKHGTTNYCIPDTFAVPAETDNRRFFTSANECVHSCQNVVPQMAGTIGLDAIVPGGIATCSEMP